MDDSGEGRTVTLIGEKSGKQVLLMLSLGALMLKHNGGIPDIPTNPLGGMPTGGSTYGSDYNRIISKDKWAEIAKHRNSICECGSGKRYKHCCERKRK